MSHVLIDAQARHAENPRTFDAPSQAELDNLKIGDMVKIGVEFKPTFSQRLNAKCSGERFWVKLTGVWNELIGIVDTEMEFFDVHGIVEGEEIRFERRHILVVK